MGFYAGTQEWHKHLVQSRNKICSEETEGKAQISRVRKWERNGLWSGIALKFMRSSRSYLPQCPCNMCCKTAVNTVVFHLSEHLTLSTQPFLTVRQCRLIQVKGFVYTLGRSCLPPEGYWEGMESLYIPIVEIWNARIWNTIQTVQLFTELGICSELRIWRSNCSFID